MPDQTRWPVLKRFDRDHLDRIALPLGGLGTGTLSLGGRGDLRDWELMGTPAKGFTPHGAFFVLRARPTGGKAVARVLEAPIPEGQYEGAWGSTVANHGLPRMRDGEFLAAYPFGQVLLTDPDLPVDVRLEAFNPLVPGDAEASGYPVAVLRYVVINRTRKPVDFSVAGTLPNVVGARSLDDRLPGSRNQYLPPGSKTPVPTILFRNTALHRQDAAFGEMGLSVLRHRGVTCKTAWVHVGWMPNLLRFWEELLQEGALSDEQRIPRGLKEKLNPRGPLLGSLCASGRLGPRQSKPVTFVITWRFPNRRGWSVPTSEAAEKKSGNGEKPKPAFVGNLYATRFKDTTAVLRDFVPRLPTLEKRTTEFVEAFCASDLPVVVKEAALFNVSTLRSETCFRTPDGTFFGFEGCCDEIGCCPGSCTHVWNYEHTLPFLFGDLARTMREVEFLHATDDEGFMNFRAPLPLDTEVSFCYASADGQMGCLMKLYREWKHSGDDAWLRRLWPRARKALEFCWIPGGWDADRDGLMEGCQHNTMDVEYYGPNPQMQGWYLGALRAAEEMARYLGEATFADDCATLFDAGSRKMDRLLFNGEYYEQQVRAERRRKVDPRLRIHPYRADSRGQPVNQLGRGCLVDQLAGHAMARICGLGSLTREALVRKTLRSIMKYNWRDHFWSHVNVLRSFVLQDESALLMASYARVERPENPFPYFTEVMTGFEYTAAIGMLYEGRERDGLKVIEAIRRRYDGKKRSPFDEAECGHHYARAMAAWGAVIALTGFQYSAVEKSIAFDARPGTFFWSTGYAWGTVKIRRISSGWSIEVKPLRGALSLRTVRVGGEHSKDLGRPRTVSRTRPLRVRVPTA